jgi:hypothetical protein
MNVGRTGRRSRSLKFEDSSLKPEEGRVPSPGEDEAAPRGGTRPSDWELEMRRVGARGLQRGWDTAS